MCCVCMCVLGVHVCVMCYVCMRVLCVHVCVRCACVCCVCMCVVCMCNVCVVCVHMCIPYDVIASLCSSTATRNICLHNTKLAGKTEGINTEHRDFCYKAFNFHLIIE